MSASLCPYCGIRPIRTSPTKPSVHCGHATCRLSRRRETNARSHRAGLARRKAGRAALVADRPATTPGATFTCVICQQPYTPPDRRRRVLCDRPGCRLAYQARAAASSNAIHREEIRQRQRQRRKEQSATRRASDHARYVARQSAAEVERLYQQARAARLRRERETGQRTYTIEDGWQQRAGRSCLDGECRLSEVA